MNVRHVDESPDVHTLSGAYALDALDAEERRQFEQHLQVCASCPDEVRTLRATAAALGASRPLEPPPHLRSAVLLAAERILQERPAVDELSSRRSARWRPERLGTIAAAILLLATIGLGTGVVVSQDRLDDARRQAQELESRLDRLTETSSVALASGGELRVTRGEGSAVAELVDAPAPPPGRTYQLWLLSAEGEAEPAGLLPAGTDEAYVEGLAGAAAVAVTEEPMGGSPQPTTTPLGVVPLTAA